MGTQLQKIQEDSLSSYVPRGNNFLQQILKDHFNDFINQYDEKYASTYGNYRIDRIKKVVEEFLKCGDFTKGVARVKCQNKECHHDYFFPLSCLSFYLCPSCLQKRILLFGEQMADEVLLKLPHRQFVFTIPKCLRPYFVHNRTLFSDVSHLIFDLIREYYDEVAGKPISSTKQMTELFRRKVIKYFEENKLINTDFAKNLLSWKNSGFSSDNSVRIFSSDRAGTIRPGRAAILY